MNYLALIVVLTASATTALPAETNKYNNDEAKATNEQSGSNLGKIIGSR